jgi:hypothetical protein
MPRLAPANYRPAQGLGGVRAVAGLGCGSACACSQAEGSLGMMEFVKNPIFWGMAATLAVAVFTIWRESR